MALRRCRAAFDFRWGFADGLAYFGRSPLVRAFLGRALKICPRQKVIDDLRRMAFGRRRGDWSPPIAQIYARERPRDFKAGIRKCWPSLCLCVAGHGRR